MWLRLCVNFVLLLSVMNYCRASFDLMTRIHQLAPLLYIINFSTLRFRVQNETTFISAKNRVNLSSISEVRSYITEWPRFLAHSVLQWRRGREGQGATVPSENFLLVGKFCWKKTSSVREFSVHPEIQKPGQAEQSKVVSESETTF